MIKLEFPSDRPDIALALGQALTAIGTGTALCSSPAPTIAKDADHTEPTEDPKPTTGATSSPLEAQPSADTAENAPTTSESASASPPVDEHGVAKDERFCGTATEPFYASGKRSGQWKKRKGVSDEAYDAWYSEQLAASEPAASVSQEPVEEQVDTAGAFAAPSAQPAQAEGPAVPHDAGTFMGWLATKQAAQLLVQADINEAYATAGVEVADLFNGDAAQIAANVAKLHGILSVKAGA